MNESMLSNCTSGGCGAKLSSGELSQLLSALPKSGDKRLLVGFEKSDDAAVYDIGNGRAVISTVDFFPPMVDDPYAFGQIAAANALSDVYAMGGEPFLALNLVCFPERLPKTMLTDILRGGADKVLEAGAAIGGGHSIYDHEPKYGLSVLGFVDADRIIRNSTPRIGDSLILTKRLGTGLIMAALRAQAASEAAVDAAIASMTRLNANAARLMRGYDVSACTDITGFGLLNHLSEMCEGDVSAIVRPNALPRFDEAMDYAGEYLLTAAGQRNRERFCGGGEVDSLPFALQELMFDPQTSGGLLIAVDPGQAHALLMELQSSGECAAVIGRVSGPSLSKIEFEE